MSLHGRTTIRGVWVSVFRPTEVRDTDASKRRTFADEPTLRLRGTVEGISAELARTVFGAEVKAEARVRFPARLGAALPDVREKDGVLVEGGPLAGRRFTAVATRPEVGRPRQTRLDVALRETSEVFG